MLRHADAFGTAQPVVPYLPPDWGTLGVDSHDATRTRKFVVRCMNVPWAQFMRCSGQQLNVLQTSAAWGSGPALVQVGPRAPELAVATPHPPSRLRLVMNEHNKVSTADMLRPILFKNTPTHEFHVIHIVSSLVAAAISACPSHEVESVCQEWAGHAGRAGLLRPVFPPGSHNHTDSCASNIRRRGECTRSLA